MGGKKQIHALQINFADEGSKALGRLENGYQYVVAVSNDGRKWRPIIDRRSDDRRNDGRDSPHDYEPLKKPVSARYVRITNVHMPAGALFSISGFRIFGEGRGKAPARVQGVVATRDETDRRHAQINWSPASKAGFYIVRFGIAPDRLFGNYQVYETTRLDVRSLNADVTYYVTVDSVNENGIMQGKTAIVLH